MKVDGRSNTMGNDCNRLVSLQVIRGLASFLIILAHLKFPLDSIFGKTELPVLLRGAGFAVGVDVFFVLSGFVISMSAAKRQFNCWEFVSKRFKRVFPFLWIASLPYIIVLAAKGIESGDFPWRILWNSVFLLPLFDKLSLNDPAHPFGWTLGFEIWFYVAFALLLYANAKYATTMLPIVFSIAVPTAFFWSSFSWKFPYFMCHPFCLEFAFGCIAFQLSEIVGLPNRLMQAFGFVGVVTLLFTVPAFENLGWHNTIRMNPDDCLIRVGVWGVPAALVLLGAISLEPILRKLRWIAIPVLLGEASYAIYLVQPSTFWGLEYIASVVSISSLGVLGASLLIVCITIMIGLLFHHLVEKPILRFFARPNSKGIVKPLLKGVN